MPDLASGLLTLFVAIGCPSFYTFILVRYRLRYGVKPTAAGILLTAAGWISGFVMIAEGILTISPTEPPDGLHVAAIAAAIYVFLWYSSLALFGGFGVMARRAE